MTELQKQVFYFDGKKYRGRNVVGFRSGRLVGVAPTDKVDSSRSRIWIWKCDCGNLIERSKHTVVREHTSSCGCLIKEINRDRWAKPKGEASFNVLFKTYKDAAYKRGYSFNLNKEQFKELTKDNCYYCGKSPSTIKNNKNNNGEYVYNGIDRTDNSKGYSIDNCVTCCEYCNRAKYTRNLDEYILWLKRTYNHLFRPNIGPFTVSVVKS